MKKWRRGLWEGQDVLWLCGAGHPGSKPWVFVRSEDGAYVYGIGYGEGQYEWTIAKSEIG